MPPRSPVPPTPARSACISPAAIAAALSDSSTAGNPAESEPCDSAPLRPAVQSIMAAWHASCTDARESVAAVEDISAPLRQPSAKAMVWAVRNVWFGADKEMTALAYAVSPRKPSS